MSREPRGRRRDRRRLSRTGHSDVDQPGDGDRKDYPHLPSPCTHRQVSFAELSVAGTPKFNLGDDGVNTDCIVLPTSRYAAAIDRNSRGSQNGTAELPCPNAQAPQIG